MSEIQQLTYGLIVTLVGMGIVFLVLIGLSYMLDALKILSNRGNAEKKVEPAKIVEKVEEPAEVISAPEEDEEELVAVISAALASFMGSSSNLAIKSINRVEGNTPVWAKVGRQEQMYNRL